MTDEELVYQKNAEILFNLIGLKVAFKNPTKYYHAGEYIKCYEIRSIVSVDLKFKPFPSVIVYFSDGLNHEFKTIDDFDSLICKVGQYGSISEMLKDLGFCM